MVNKYFPSQLPWITPASDDQMLLADTSNNDESSVSTVEDIVQAGMAVLDSDDLPEWATNLYISPADQAKLNGIQNGAQVNQVNSVNGVQGNVTLTQDDVLNGGTYVQTENNFSAWAIANLATAYSHSQDINGNPHNTTKAMIGLGNVVNELQLSTTAWNFTPLPEKSDVQFHLNDLTVIQDSSDADNIKKVKNQTNLIWYAGYIQEWGTSINYNSFSFAWSTTYDINSIVTVGSNIYKCLVSHQSTVFAADLANGYWLSIGWGTGTNPINITVGNVAPIAPWVLLGDVYIDYATGDIYVWDWAVWNLNGGGGSGWVNYVTAPTTVGDKVTFSVGVNADLMDETTIDWDSGSETLSFPSTVTVEFDGTTINHINWATTNYDNTTVVNNNGGTINNTGTTINNDAVTTNYTNGSVTNYDNTTTVNMSGTTNITNANITNLTISGSVIGANTAWIEDFVWDWVTTIFTLANLPASDAFVWVSGNGVFSQDGVALDYTVSGLNVTFNTAPTLGYNIQIHYIQSLWTPLSFLSQVPTGTVDGVNDTFAIANAVNTNSESIYINWLLQYPTTHYTLTGTSLVFVTPPSIGDNLFAKWVY